MIAAVTEASQVAEARRLVSAYARRAGVAEGRIGDVALVVTELATNLLKHAGGGQILADYRRDGDGAGLEVLALDRGSGMIDVARWCWRGRDGSDLIFGGPPRRRGFLCR